jgi:hypothetical protein
MPPLNKTPLLAAAAASALLASCAAVGPNFAPPAAPATPGYAMAGDPASAIPALGQNAESAGDW